ncbi:MAG TPA: TolC family protein [Terriglobia bacterium]|nr:TolC family protein [Terriglobia bacterium]
MSGRDRRAPELLIAGLALLWIMGGAQAACAESPPPKPLTLGEVVHYALANYPAVRASLEHVTGAAASVKLARTNYLPRLDSLWQSNRATDNNITGLLLPQPFLPSISGPVPLSTSYRGAWSSAGGLLLTWEPVDFGLRRAEVDAAKGTVNQANSAVVLTQLQVAAAVAEAFFTLMTNEQTQKATLANLDRWQVFAKAVHVLVDHELRPGADASRADAEVAAARILEVQARGEVESARAVLAALMGAAGNRLAIDAGALLTLPAEGALAPAEVSSHPQALLEQATIRQLRAQEHVLDRTDYPRFFFQSSVYGRGSGIGPDGSFAGGLNGLGLERGNWAAGVTILFPDLFDYAALRARKQALAASEREEAARYDQTIQDLTGRLGQARILFQTALQVAKNTPVELQAARATETQSRARYQAGLATIVEVAEAESLLAQAEIGDAVARVNAWRALLGIAEAQGNLEPFLQIVATAPAGGP